MKKSIILGSSSTYRKALLERLRLTFTCHSPNIDEAPKPLEQPEELVKRLSITKAKNIAAQRQSHENNNDALIIGSDQIAVLGKQILGKPLTEENAVEQLASFSGKKVSFLTGLCLLNEAEGHYQYSLNHFHVYFKKLSKEEIVRYVALEQPLDCAGSFKCEGLGIALFEKMEGDDPNSLIGLPLISLCDMLKKEGINPLG